MKAFILNELGDKFANPPNFEIKKSFEDSSKSNPLVFLLPGSDPLNLLIKFAENKMKRMKIISLGQGQGYFAQKAIQEATLNGC